MYVLLIRFSRVSGSELRKCVVADGKALTGIVLCKVLYVGSWWLYRQCVPTLSQSKLTWLATAARTSRAESVLCLIKHHITSHESAATSYITSSQKLTLGKRNSKKYSKNYHHHVRNLAFFRSIKFLSKKSKPEKKTVSFRSLDTTVLEVYGDLKTAFLFLLGG